MASFLLNPMAHLNLFSDIWPRCKQHFAPFSTVHSLSSYEIRPNTQLVYHCIYTATVILSHKDITCYVLITIVFNSTKNNNYFILPFSTLYHQNTANINIKIIINPNTDYNQIKLEASGDVVVIMTAICYCIYLLL